MKGSSGYNTLKVYQGKSEILCYVLVYNLQVTGYKFFHNTLLQGIRERRRLLIPKNILLYPSNKGIIFLVADIILVENLLRISCNLNICK